jgi:hypothetical protein
MTQISVLEVGYIELLELKLDVPRNHFFLPQRENYVEVRSTSGKKTV